MCYTRTIYHPIRGVADVLTACDNKAYTDLGIGVLYREAAPRASYGETI
jgi:hypothetical protein